MLWPYLHLLACISPRLAAALRFQACALLTLDADQLKQALTVKVTSRFSSPLDVPKANAVRDTLAQRIYSQLFDHVVRTHC